MPFFRGWPRTASCRAGKLLAPKVGVPGILFEISALLIPIRTSRSTLSRPAQVGQLWEPNYRIPNHCVLEYRYCISPAQADTCLLRAERVARGAETSVVSPGCVVAGVSALAGATRHHAQLSRAACQRVTRSGLNFFRNSVQEGRLVESTRPIG